jgi:Aspartokinases
MATSGIKVFKFGGASVKSADGIRNLAKIVQRYSSARVVMVVSAMGKTTNALERILAAYLGNNAETLKLEFDTLKSYHFDIACNLAGDSNSSLMFVELEQLFGGLNTRLTTKPTENYDYNYDQIVSYGELFATTIVSIYLNQSDVANRWVDIRTCLKSDTSYREGIIDFITSESHCQEEFGFAGEKLYVTQGFIAGTPAGTTTTLGREGSDYTAAILANLLDAESLTIWKDVDGVRNADPKLFKNTCKLDFVSYQEAIELAYCGAQIIHPKNN